MTENPWNALDEQQKIEVAGSMREMFAGAGWQFLKRWIEWRVAVIQERNDTIPIDTEENRRELDRNRQEILVWRAIVKKPVEYIQNAETLIRERTPAGEEDGEER